MKNLELRAREAIKAVEYKIQVAEQNAKRLAEKGNYIAAAEETIKAANLVSAYVHMAYWLPEFVPDWFREKYRIPDKKYIGHEE